MSLFLVIRLIKVMEEHIRTYQGNIDKLCSIQEKTIDIDYSGPKHKELRAVLKKHIPLKNIPSNILAINAFCYKISNGKQIDAPKVVYDGAGSFSFPDPKINQFNYISFCYADNTDADVFVILNRNDALELYTSGTGTIRKTDNSDIIRSYIKQKSEKMIMSTQNAQNHFTTAPFVKKIQDYRKAYLSDRSNPELKQFCVKTIVSTEKEIERGASVMTVEDINVELSRTDMMTRYKAELEEIRGKTETFRYNSKEFVAEIADLNKTIKKAKDSLTVARADENKFKSQPAALAKHKEILSAMEKSVAGYVAKSDDLVARHKACKDKLIRISTNKDQKIKIIKDIVDILDKDSSIRRAHNIINQSAVSITVRAFNYSPDLLGAIRI